MGKCVSPRPGGHRGGCGDRDCGAFPGAGVAPHPRDHASRLGTARPAGGDRGPDAASRADAARHRPPHHRGQEEAGPDRRARDRVRSSLRSSSARAPPARPREPRGPRRGRAVIPRAMPKRARREPVLVRRLVLTTVKLNHAEAGVPLFDVDLRLGEGSRIREARFETSDGGSGCCCGRAASTPPRCGSARQTGLSRWARRSPSTRSTAQGTLRGQSLEIDNDRGRALRRHARRQRAGRLGKADCSSRARRSLPASTSCRCRRRSASPRSSRGGSRPTLRSRARENTGRAARGALA